MGGRGSGSVLSRASDEQLRNLQTLNQSNPQALSQIANEAARRGRLVDKTSFTNDGLGQWQLDIPGVGGASILDESDTRAGGYGQMRAYTVTTWDKDYNIGETRTFGSLNAAKQAAKDEIKRRNR